MELFRLAWKYLFRRHQWFPTGRTRRWEEWDNAYGKSYNTDREYACYCGKRRWS